MATNIVIEDITNGSVVNNEWQGTGIFDVLMSAVDKNIQLQYSSGRIKSTDYANVYMQSMQAVLAQSIQYGLQEKLTEAQIDGIIAENELKAKELEIKEQELALRQAELDRLQNTTEAELEKQWGYDVTRDTEGKLVLGSSTGEGQVDKDIALKEEQEKTVYTERVLKDKQAAQLGLDEVVKTANSSPEAVYAPKYNEV